MSLNRVHVVKVGGNELDDPEFVALFANAVAAACHRSERLVVVHGGGKALTELLSVLDIPARFVDGLRVTDAQTRDAALMVLSGLANKRLVAALRAAGLDALGVSGVDGELIQVVPLAPELAYVGKPSLVRAKLLAEWLEKGLTPVVAPMSLGLDGEIYNVNADHVAGAIAAAMEAELLTFVTNVVGVLDASHALIPRLTAAEAETLIADGVIAGGMIPKVRTALEALSAGIRRVRITNLDGLARDNGTTFVA